MIRWYLLSVRNYFLLFSGLIIRACYIFIPDEVGVLRKLFSFTLNVHSI